MNKCIHTHSDWLEDVREKCAEREEFQELVVEAREVELAENAAVGRVYVVMGEPSKILNQCTRGQYTRHGHTLVASAGRDAQGDTP